MQVLLADIADAISIGIATAISIVLVAVMGMLRTFFLSLPQPSVGGPCAKAASSQVQGPPHVGEGWGC